MKNAKFLLVTLGIVGLNLLIWGLYINNSNESIVYKDKSIEKFYSNAISMMYETESGTGIYEESKGASWPSSGYKFNSVLSKCENGSTLTWDESNKKVKMTGNVSDKCYVYFDVMVPTIADVCSNGSNLASCVKSFYNTYGSDVSNIYYHKNLENSAEDSSYRYAGSYESVNNYVCFGSNTGECPWDNMYRIIGVFDNQVKLIKADYAKASELGTGGDYWSTYSTVPNTYKGKNGADGIGRYNWNRNNSDNSKSDWDVSRLNTTNLNGTYLNSFDATWQGKIALTNWIIGGNTYEKIAETNAYGAYYNDLINPLSKTTYSAKIGLMYVSDYGFAAKKEAWSLGLRNYNNKTASSSNWILNGLEEWYITKQSASDNTAFYLGREGTMAAGQVYRVPYAVRPCFYLNTNITFKSGSGSMSDPIFIN